MDDLAQKERLSNLIMTGFKDRGHTPNKVMKEPNELLGLKPNANTIQYILKLPQRDDD